MNSSTDDSQALTRAIDDVPVPAPSSSVELQGKDLVITVESEPKSLLPNSVITALALFGGAAFICPGVFLVFAILLPIALISGGIIYLIAPQMYARPVDTETLVISADELQLVESSVRNAKGRQHDREKGRTSIRRNDVTSTELIEPSDDNPTAGIRITTGDKSLLFGSPLTVSDDDTAPDEDTRRELEWLHGIIDSHLRDIDGST